MGVSPAALTAAEVGLTWPHGDPDALRTAATRAGSVAQQLGAMSGQLRQAAGQAGPAWSGHAGESFVHALDTDCSTLEAAARSHQSVAAALVRLAAVVEEAQQTVRRAALRLSEALAAETGATSRALGARAAADTLTVQAATDPAEVMLAGNGPITRKADQAATDAQIAEGAARIAREEAQRAHHSARAEAAAAIDRVSAADRAVASELGGLHAVRTAARLGGLTLFGGALLRVKELRGFEKAAKDLVQREWYTLKWVREWVEAPSKAHFMEGFKYSDVFKAPEYWNESGLGKKVGGLVTELGGHSDVVAKGARWLNDAEKATPVFRKLGVAGSAISTGMDVKKLIEDGNPITAFRRDPSGYAVDLTQTAFDASTTAFLAAPNLGTGAAFAVTGAAWLGAETWHHAGDIEHVAGAAVHATEHVLGEGAHAAAGLLHHLNPFD
jgi:uncharacterized protein YukE